MAEIRFLVFSFLILSICPSSCSTTLLRAADILSKSDHFSMSLTLKLAAETLDLRSPSATVFAPSDFAFLRSGQPPLFLLRRQISPVALSLETLKSLPCGTRIPTLLPNQSLTVTASLGLDGFVSINDVRIDEKAMIDGSSVVIYGTDEFFNASPGESFASIAKLLRSRGYSIMASFLDAQLTDSNKENGTNLTIFAPDDHEFAKLTRNMSDYSETFRRHVVPRMLPWKDLIKCELGTKLPTFSRGFEINVTVIDGVPVLNDAPVVLRDLYRSDWLVVHGIHGLIKARNNQEEESTDGSSS